MELHHSAEQGSPHGLGCHDLRDLVLQALYVVIETCGPLVIGIINLGAHKCRSLHTSSVQHTS